MSPRSLFSPAFTRVLAACALTVSAVTLAGCSGGADQAPPVAAASTGPDTCGVAPLQVHVGEFFDVVMLQNFEAIVPSHRVLVLKPDTVASTDVVPERAVVKTDNKSIITSITCG